MTRAALVAAAVLAAPCAGTDPWPGEPGTPEYEAAAALVKQLGHPRFAVREAAARELVGMGGTAVPALRAGTRSADEEVRTRCTALIPQARAAEWARRADAYRADVGGRQAHDLPLLAEWERLMAPPDAASRALFAELVREDGDFLHAVAVDRKKAARYGLARSRVILDRVRDHKAQVRAEPVELLAVLFIDALDPAWVGLPNTGGPADLLRNPGLAEALGAVRTGPAVGRLLARWVAAHAPNDPRPRAEFADLARRQPFPDAAPTLIELARDTTTRYPVHRVLAIEALGAVGGKEAAATLAELVADEEPLFRRYRRDDAPIPLFGDQALAALIVLHGKKPEDFGLRAVPSSFGRPWSHDSVPVTMYVFPTDDARDEAVRKWNDEVAGKGGGKK